MLKATGKGSNERGFAAIIISIVLVVVLSLITVGFAALMRKEQRAALDRQLSNAAYYAAESGINDGVGAVRAGFATAKASCAQYGTGPKDTPLTGLTGKNLSAATQYLTSSGVDNGSNANYSCLIINPNPSTLEYGSVRVGQPTTSVLTGADAAGATQNVDVLVFSWQDANGGNTFGPVTNNPGCPPIGAGLFFPKVDCWKNNGSFMTGILRVGLTPVSASLNRTSLETSSYTGFMYPNSGSRLSLPSSYAGNASTSPSGVPGDSYSGHTGPNSGDIVAGSCYGGNTPSTPRFCSVAVTNLGSDTYLLHLSSVYASTQVTVTPFNCTTINPGTCTRIYLKGAQTLIDSTGKSQDVLRRIQVRLPTRNSYDYPEFSLATGGPICKLLTTYPPNLATGTPGNTTNFCNPL